MEPKDIHSDNERTWQALTNQNWVSDRHTKDVHYWGKNFVWSDGASDACEWIGPDPSPSFRLCVSCSKARCKELSKDLTLDERSSSSCVNESQDVEDVLKVNVHVK